MDLKEMELWLHKVSLDAVEEWFVEQINNPYDSFHLYFKRGGIKISNEEPEGYELVSGQRISPAWSCAKVYQYVRDMIRKIPCLPKEE